MSLIICQEGEVYPIKKITGNDETKKFLNSLGFVVGEEVSIISKNGDNMIVNIKDSRIALGRSMASRIMI
ncbi:MAG: ferrous iron transport protein A [Candidatus Cellulosilyticum pullistercoris]|uniref:Ferrous iron transport protein A n=1 Tax=Candidatus Cellulosilyticum pullistercoris TaxID=2838521 RepID=A0A9E2NLF5_9FIRM|nr:ferrous iron transport protein A [Candidatus Cellulosilyticum pullistercoris]